MYSGCRREFIGSERKEDASSQKTRRQRLTEVLRARKNATRKRFKATMTARKSVWGRNDRTSLRSTVASSELSVSIGT